MTGLRSTGGLTFAGELEAYRQFPHERETNGKVHYYIFHVFNILGDPETPLYICQPRTFSLTYPSSLNAGTTLVETRVLSQGTPVANAIVTLRVHNTPDVHSAVTDAAGYTRLPVSVDRSTDYVQMTVWKAGYFMRYQDIPVVPADFDPKITSVNWTAGSDNLPNPGEAPQLTLTVQNLGTASADNLTADLVSLDSRITVTSGAATFGTIAPNASATSNSLLLVIGNQIEDREQPQMRVTFHGSVDVSREFLVPIAAADPVMISYSVNDGNDGILDPGETATITVTATNVGHHDGTNLQAEVSSWDNSVSFPENIVGWTSLSIGQSGASDNPFQITLANGVTPGRQILLRYRVSNGNVVLTTKYQMLVAGHVTSTAPTGPDAYGYYAYENMDIGFSSTPTYNWIELDPEHGGSGAIAHVVHDDTSNFTMALPQPFVFYGQTFSNIWVSSNGWFSFELATLPEFRNWEIPSPIGPPSMVAVLWDDLIGKRMSPVADTVFYVWTRDDASDNRFILEWRCFSRRGIGESPGFPNTAYCNFEAILEFNGNNNGSILMQYDAVANIDNVDNYASVGIQDSYHQRGLGLTYANIYPATVDTVRAGRAIRFTTVPPDGFLDANEPLESGIPKTFAFHNAYPNPFNPITELRFDLPETGHVTLRIFDVLGREVAVLLDENRPAGAYSATFDAHTLSSGLYFARLSSGTHTQVQKLMLVK
jgi:hypothetical protein